MLFTNIIYSQDLVLGTNPLKNYYVFNGNHTFNGNIIVKSGVVLVMKCGVFKFNANKCIRVELGGRLRLFNSTLTQVADNSNANSVTLNRLNNWLGIQINGNPNIPQQTISTCENAPVCSSMSNTRDSSYSDHGASDQGELQMHKSKIRYSNFGINMGPFQPSNSVLQNQGGLLIARECSFENNYYYHINFHQYMFLNKSIITKNQFIYDDLTEANSPWPTFGHSHTDITNVGNSFKYNIEYNNFSVKTLFNNFRAINNYGSMHIVNNSFKYHIAGIVFRSWTPFSFPNFNLAYGNTFDRCQVAIDVRDESNTRVEYNTITPCTFTRWKNGSTTDFFTYFSNGQLPSYGPNQNSTIGIYNTANNFRCSYNKYTTSSTISSEDAAIVSYASLSLSSYIFKNTTKSAVTGFRCIGPNNGFKIECNTFSTSKIGDILIDPNGVIINQGSLSKPTGNAFTTLVGRSDLNNKNITTYSGSKWKFFYKLGSSSETPNPFTAATIDVLSTNKSNLCTPIYESFGLDLPTGCANTRVYQTDKKGYSNIRLKLDSIQLGGITEDERDEFDNLLVDYDIVMTNIIDGFASNHLRFGYNVNDSIKSFLVSHNTINSKFMLVRFYIGIKDFSNAQSLLDSLVYDFPDSEMVNKYVKYNSFISDMLQNNDSSNSWLFSHFNQIKEIADTSGYMASCARDLTQLIADLDTSNTYHNTQMYFNYLPEILDSIGVDTPTDSVSVYPIPFSSNLTIQIENFTGNSRTFSIKLKDMSGSEIYSNNSFSVSANSVNSDIIETNEVVQGLYFIQVYENNILIDVRLINKN